MEIPTVVAEIQISYNPRVKPSSRPWINTSKSCYDILLQTWNMDTLELREEFKVLYLNRANRLLGYYNLSTGGVAGTVADPKLIFSSALKANASGIILAHNHPSGNLTPSQSDIALTKKIREGGKFLEIQLLDHLIITSESYYSFADDGII